MKKGRKISGGKYKKSRKKKLYEKKGQGVVVKLGPEKRNIKKVTGGNKKVFLLKTNFVNITSHRPGDTAKKLEIKNVLETPSNRFLARQNIITKGTIVKNDEALTTAKASNLSVLYNKLLSMN